MISPRLQFARIICRNLPPIIAQNIREWIYPLKTAQKDDQEFVVRSQTGSLFTNRTSDFHGYPFSVHGYYEWRNWAIALAYCAPGDTIIEIGANIGTETVGFSDIVGPSGKVFAFEPLPANLSMLKSSLKLNGNNNIEVLPYAVGHIHNFVQFDVPPKTSSGIGHIIGSNESHASESIKVECVTLDSFADRIGKASIIFTDTEGAEVMVLQGARNYIRQYKPALVLEASPKLLTRAGSSLDTLFQELKCLGYEAYHIDRLGLSKIQCSDAKHASNWLCLETGNTSKASVIEKHLQVCGLLPCIAGINPLCRKPSR